MVIFNKKIVFMLQNAVKSFVSRVIFCPPPPPSKIKWPLPKRNRFVMFYVMGSAPGMEGRFTTVLVKQKVLSTDTC